MAVLMCLSIVLPACGEKTTDITDTGDVTGTESQETTPAAPSVPVKNFGGREFKVFTSNWWDNNTLKVQDVRPEEYNGELVNDAAYERVVKIEDIYNCKITQIQGVYELLDDFNKLQTSIQAGEDFCDIAMMRGLYYTKLFTDNYIIDLDKLENIDFNNPWWQKDCSEALRIGGKRYGVSGYMSMVEITLVCTICFNKTVITDYNLESPYELVKDGKWTLDKMVEMAKVVTHDLNGDGIMTWEDMWGINYSRDTVWNLLNSCGVKMLELDSKGYPQIVIDNEQNLPRAQNVLVKFFNEDYCANYRRVPNAFDDGTVLFNFRYAGSVIGARVFDIEMGVVPVTKYDEAQNDYMSNIYGLGLPIICVPVTNNDMADTGLFMEAFSYEGYKNIVPVYYETVLKTKGARDNESADMIDYIFNNLSYDTGTLLNFGDLTQTICALAETQDTNLASHIARNKAKCEAEIDSIMERIMSEGK